MKILPFSKKIIIAFAFLLILAALFQMSAYAEGGGQAAYSGSGSGVASGTEASSGAVSASFTQSLLPESETASGGATAQGPVAFASPDDVLTLDPVLQEVVNGELGRPINSPVTVEDMGSITVLSHTGPYDTESEDPRLKSLEGLQHAVNLESIYIVNADFAGAASPLAPLAALTRLQNLSLGNSFLAGEALADLNGLTSLRSLQLYINPISSFAPLEPLLTHFWAKLKAYNDDASNPEAPPETLYLYYELPINDFSGMKKYLDLRCEIERQYKPDTDGDGKRDELTDQEFHSILRYTFRGITPSVPDLNSYPYYITTWGYVSSLHNPLPAIWQNADGTATIDSGLTDFFGNRSLFTINANWKDDLLAGDAANFAAHVGIRDLYMHFYFLRTGEESPMLDFDPIVREYFKFTSRQREITPGTIVTEYYYETPYFNVVPYNPKDPTSPEHFQDTQTFAGEEAESYNQLTVYYFEMKNIGQPLAELDAIDPEINKAIYPYFNKETDFDYAAAKTQGFKPVDDAITNQALTTIVFGLPYMPSNGGFGYNSGRALAFEQDIYLLSPLDPYLVGANDETISLDANFNPMLNVQAFDPTRTAANPTGLNPLNISAQVSWSGSVNTSKPGAYTLTYTVTSPLGRTVTGTRVINVVLAGGGSSGGQTGSGSAGLAPKTGDNTLLMNIFIGGLVASLMGFVAIAIIRKRRAK